MPIEEPTGWLAGFRARAAERRIPIFASIELTRRCNYRCVHCYLGDERAGARRQPSRDRDTDFWLRALDEWARAGVLTLLITGGEPMLHPGFEKIYRRAVELGMQVLVFTNGSRISDRILKLFRDFPPRRVEVSIYGATPRTADRVTRTPGSFRRTLTGIRRLLANGTRVSLKSVLLTLNEHELDAMEALAARLGCPFRYDAAIHACLDDRSAAPLRWRLPPERVVALEFATPERRQRWLDYYRRRPPAPATDRLYPCGAGASAFHVNALGQLQPCLLSVSYCCEWRGRPFEKVWREDLAAIRERRSPAEAADQPWEERWLGNACPAFHALESGSEERESDYAARVARFRRAALERIARQADVASAK